MDPFLGFGFAWMRFQSTQRLCGPPAQRTDQRAVVLVRNLAGAVIELQLLQRRKRPITLLGELQPAALERVGLNQPVFSGRYPRSPQEGQGDYDDADDGEHDAEREPDAHARMLDPDLNPLTAVQASGVAVARRAGTR